MDRIIYLIRHGETEWNLSRRIQGWGDSPLTEHGRNQARTNGRLLKDIGVRKLFASPLGRVRETLNCMDANLHPPPMFDDRLREISMGEWEGFTYAEVQSRWPEDWARRESDRELQPPPDGESMMNLRMRVQPFVDDVLATTMHKGINEYAQFEDGVLDNRVAVVSHGITTRVLLDLLTDMTKEQKRQMRVPNNVVYQIEISDKNSTVSHFVDAQGPIRGFFYEPA